MSGLFAAVSILLQIRIELRRPSQGRGFGASVAAIRPCRARQLSHLSDRRRDFVRLERDKDVLDKPERIRQGVAHHVGIPKSSCKTVICQRARFEAHPGALGAARLTLRFKRLLQSVFRQNRRIIIL